MDKHYRPCWIDNNTLFALMYGVINQDLEIYFSYIQNIHLYNCTQWIRVHKYAYKDIIFFIFSNVAPIVPVPPMGFQLYYCVSSIVGADLYWQWKHEYHRSAKISFNIRCLCGGSQQPMMCHFNVFLMLHSTDVAG
jgi:hypothetical protein